MSTTKIRALIADIGRPTWPALVSLLDLLPAVLDRVDAAAPPAAPALGALLRDVDDAALAALPVGSRFEDFSDTNIDTWALVKGVDGGWGFKTRALEASTGQWRRMYGARYRLTRIGPEVVATATPAPVIPAKVGDTWGDLAAEQRAGVPVGSEVSGGTLGCAKVLRDDKRWVASSGEEMSLNGIDATNKITRIGPAPVPAKVGDRWGDLTAAQREGVPVGTVMRFHAYGVVTTKVDGGEWAVTGFPTHRSDGWLASDNEIIYLPTVAK